jgi:hypothetical protein
VLGEGAVGEGEGAGGRPWSSSDNPLGTKFVVAIMKWNEKFA